jgi:cytochrome c553
MNFVAIAFLLLPTLGLAAIAENVVGDAGRGATLSMPCIACHGVKGEGVAESGSPRLAGQDAYYLEKQLRDYASGLRNNPIMTPLAKTLSEQQRSDIAVFFATLSAPPGAPASDVDQKLFARGRLLSRTGDESKQLQACGNCHGPDGRGEAFAAPYLEGQLATYLSSSIAAWKAGTRKNDGGEIMASVATRLDEEDISAIAAYFSSLSSP